MPRTELPREYAPVPNILELRASEYLKPRAPSTSAVARELSEREAGAIRRLAVWSTAWAAGAGVISGAIIGGLEIFVRQELIGAEAQGEWLAHLPEWAGFFAVAAIVSVVEIAFLYWNALHTVGQMSRHAHVGLSGGGYRELVARGLARAALEFPNPDTHVFGIDPYAYVSKWRLTAKNLLYKTKVGVSSFLLRVTLRRVIGRMTVRGLIPLLAAPLYAAWNAIITWRLLRAVRLRIFAPAVIEERVRHMQAAREHLTRETVRVTLGGVGELLKRARDAHPSYVFLLGRLIDVLEPGDEVLDVDWAASKTHLRNLAEAERDLVLDVLVVAALLAGKVRRAQIELLEEAHDHAGLTLRTEALRPLRRRLLRGQRIARGDLRASRKTPQIRARGRPS